MRVWDPRERIPAAEVLRAAPTLATMRVLRGAGAPRFAFTEPHGGVVAQ